MLTSTQCQVVAYTDEGEFYCPTCAARKYGVADPRTESGYRLTGSSRTKEAYLTPVLQYDLDTYEGETASEYEMEGYDEQTAADLAKVTCGGCHTEIDG